jgi:protease I
MREKRALIMTCEGYKDYEAIYPYYRLLEEGFQVDVISNTVGKVKGVLGGSIPSHYLLSELESNEIFNKFLDGYEILIIPGGVTSLEKLRLESRAVAFVAEWNKNNKLIGSICSGAQMLITAKVVESRKISAYYSMEQDVWNAGAIFVDAPAVVDANIVSSPHYKWVGHWMKELLQVYNKQNNESQQ